MIHNLRVIISFLVFFQFLFQPIFSQEPQSPGKFTVKEAVDYAIQHSYDVKNGMLDVSIAKKKIWETTAIGLPNFNIDLMYQYTFSVPEMDFGIPYLNKATGRQIMAQVRDTIFLPKLRAPVKLGTKQSTTIDFTLSQLVFSGEYIVGLQASKTYKIFSELNLQKIKNDVKELVTSSYYSVLVLRENIKTLENTLENINKIAYEMEQMLKVGFIEDTDVDQIKLTASNIKIAKTTLERQVDVAEKLLKFQMGVKLDSEIILSDDLKTVLQADEIEKLMILPLKIEDNIGYQLTETNEKLQKLSYKREWSSVLPRISAFYRHKKIVNAPDFNFMSPDILGVSVNIPVFASGSRYSKIQQAKMELEKARNIKMKTSEALILEYKQSISDLTAAYQTYQTQKKSVELSKKIYDKTVIKYKEGISSSMDLTQVQNQYLESQGNYFNAILDLLNRKIHLEKILAKNQNLQFD